jgi:hypothetical protein
LGEWGTEAAGEVVVGSIEEVGGVGKGSCRRGCFGRHRRGWWSAMEREFSSRGRREREGKREGKGSWGRGYYGKHRGGGVLEAKKGLSR